MIVLRIDVNGHSADVRWAGAEAVVGSGAAAAIQRDDAGWAAREAVLVHVGSGVLLVRADGSGQWRMVVGDVVTLGRARLTLVGLLPLAGTDDEPREVAPALADLDPAPPGAAGFAVEPEASRPSAGAGASAATSWTAAVRAASTAPLAAASPAAASGTAGPAPTATRPPPPPAPPTPPTQRDGRSFDEELLAVLRRSPWWVLSAALHGLVFLILTLTASARATAPAEPSFYGLVTAEAPPDHPLESGGPTERTEVDAVPDEVRAPEIDDLEVEPPPIPDDVLPVERGDPAPVLPMEPEMADETETPPPVVGPDASVTRARVAEKNAVLKKPPAADLERIVDADERAAEVNRRAAAKVRDVIAKGAGALGRALRGLKTDDILVVRGSFDHMESVLEELGIPFTLLSPYELPATDLGKHKVIFWNCGENVLRPHEHERVVRAVRDFVEQGGYLFSTDWAVANLLVPAFPGYVRTQGRMRPLPELIVDVVPAEGAASHVLLDGVFSEEATPRWWLESASFDVEVLRKDLVEVLAQAPALAKPPFQRSTALAVTFTFGRGRVLHVMGHYYQQKGNVAGAVGAQRLPLNFVRMRLEAAGAPPK